MSRLSYTWMIFWSIPLTWKLTTLWFTKYYSILLIMTYMSNHKNVLLINPPLIILVLMLNTDVYGWIQPNLKASLTGQYPQNWKNCAHFWNFVTFTDALSLIILTLLSLSLFWHRKTNYGLGESINSKPSDFFAATPMLLNPNLHKSLWIMTDALLVAAGAVLSQQDDNGIWKPCAFMSKSFNLAE